MRCSGNQDLVTFHDKSTKQKKNAAQVIHKRSLDSSLPMSINRLMKMCNTLGYTVQYHFVYRSHVPETGVYNHSTNNIRIYDLSSEENQDIDEEKSNSFVKTEIASVSNSSALPEGLYK